MYFDTRQLAHSMAAFRLSFSLYYRKSTFLYVSLTFKHSILIQQQETTSQITRKATTNHHHHRRRRIRIEHFVATK